MKEWFVLVAELFVDPGPTGPYSDVFSGMRPNWRIPRADEIENVDGVVFVLHGGTIGPGEHGRVLIVPFTPSLWVSVRMGTTVEMLAGDRLLGKATVIGVLEGDIDW